MTRLTIRWERAQHGTVNGFVGELKARVFSIQWGITRSEDPHVLYCMLPGYTTREWKFKTEDSAQKFAAQIIERWLQLVEVDAA